MVKSHIDQTHENNVKCDSCDGTYRNPYELKRHKVFVHDDTKDVWICDICPCSGKTKSIFTSESSFESHIKSQKHIKNTQ